MKKQIVLLSILLSAAILSMSQEQCVSCFENTISIENYSSALGTYNSSLGLSSLAAGDSNTVSGNYAIALGKRNIASGIASIAAGYSNLSSGNYSFSAGYDNKALGESSIALGNNTNAEGTNAISIGYHAYANGMYSVAIGRQAFALGPAAFALGLSANAQAESSYVFGEFIEATASGTITIGHGAGIGDNYLSNNEPNSVMMGINSDSPTFFISNSGGAGKTGKIGIGNITAPEAKLHILGDDDIGRPVNASLYIASAGDYYSYLWLGDKQHEIKAKPNENFIFNTNTNHFEFKNGNVGIGTNSPKAKLQVDDGDIFIEDIDRGIIMKSPDGNCWRGTLNNTGMLEFVQVDCDDLSTGTTDHSTSRDGQVRIYPNPAGNQISVKLPQDYVGASLEISDISGKLLRTHPLKSTECNINISELSPGMYVFNIMDDAGKVLESKKIVKE